MVHFVGPENFAWPPTDSCHQRCTSLDYSECALKHLNRNISAAAEMSECGPLLKCAVHVNMVSVRNLGQQSDTNCCCCDITGCDSVCIFTARPAVSKLPILSNFNRFVSCTATCCEVAVKLLNSHSEASLSCFFGRDGVYKQDNPETLVL